MTAIGWRIATAGETGSPVRGAGTVAAVGTGVGLGLAVGDGDPVGSDEAEESGTLEVASDGLGLVVITETGFGDEPGPDPKPVA